MFQATSTYLFAQRCEEGSRRATKLERNWKFLILRLHLQDWHCVNISCHDGGNSLLQEQPEPAICQIIPGETPIERKRGQYTKLIVGVVYKYNSKRTYLGVTITYDVQCTNRLADLGDF